MRIKPKNANDQTWVWRPTATLAWDDEHGFSMTLDFDGAFDYMSEECDNFPEAIEWGVDGLQFFVKKYGTVSLFEGFKPEHPDYRTAEDIQKEFLQLLQKQNNEATGGQ